MSGGRRPAPITFQGAVKPLTVHDDVKLIHAIRLGEIKPKTLVRVGARSNWQRAETVARLQGLFALEKDTPAAAVATPTTAEPATAAGGATPPQSPPDPALTGGSPPPAQGGKATAAKPRFGRMPMAVSVAALLIAGAIAAAVAAIFSDGFARPRPSPPPSPSPPAPRYYAELNLSPRAEPNGAVLDGFVIDRGEVVDIVGPPDEAWVRLKASMPGAGYVEGPALSTTAPPKLRATYKQDRSAWESPPKPSAAPPSDHPESFDLNRDTRVFATPTFATPYAGKLISGSRVRVIGLVAEGWAEIEIRGGGVAYIRQETFDFDGTKQRAAERRAHLTAIRAQAKRDAAKAADEAKAKAEAEAAKAAAKAADELAVREARKLANLERQRLERQQQIANAQKHKGGFKNKPRADQLEQFRPEGAKDIGGEVVLTCTVDPGGSVFEGTCNAVERPPGRGFGAKAIELAYTIRWQWKRGDQPSENSIVKLPKFRWEKPREARAP